LTKSRVLKIINSIMRKFTNTLFPGFAAAVLMAGIFGINSIRDGYGDARLCAYYLVTFFLVFLLLGPVLYLYEKFRKITPTLSNNAFLLCLAFLSVTLLYVMVSIIEYISESMMGLWFGITAQNFLFVLVCISILSLLFFFWLSNLHKKTQKYYVIILAACLIGFWTVVSLDGGFKINKKGYLCQEGPNILLLTVEALRYDYLGCYGNDQIKTPNLDTLASKGVIFDNYFIQAPFTTASLSALSTGCYPFKSGARIPGQRPDQKYPAFIEELGKKGYFIKIDSSMLMRLFPDSPVLDSRLDTGNIYLYKKLRARLMRFQHIINRALGNYMSPVFGRYCFGDTTSMSQTFKLFRRIRSNRDKKWFFWTHFQANCHEPYEAPSYFIKMYTTNNEDLKTSYGAEELRHLRANPGAITDNVLQGIKAAYSAEVSCIDRQIGMIIDCLKKQGLFEKTVIILSSDHGEVLGKNGWIGHGQFLKDALVHVPLIIYAPGFEYFEGGKRISDFIEEVDIAPTIFEICDIDGAQRFNGRSLFNLFNSKGWHKDAIYSEVVKGDRSAFRACYRTKDYKLVWDSSTGEIELYNMITDPGEEENLADKLPDVATGMKERLLNFTGYAGFNDLKPDFSHVIDEDMERDLRSLGYLQ